MKCKFCNSINTRATESFSPRVTSVFCDDCKITTKEFHMAKTKEFLEYFIVFCMLATIVLAVVCILSPLAFKWVFFPGLSYFLVVAITSLTYFVKEHFKKD